jgi:hypothetical protein
MHNLTTTMDKIKEGYGNSVNNPINFAEYLMLSKDDDNDITNLKVEVLRNKDVDLRYDKISFELRNKKQFSEGIKIFANTIVI